MEQIHKISELITIREKIDETLSRPPNNKIHVIKDGKVNIFPTPGKGHKLSLYYSRTFICSISFACYDSEVEKYRPEYISTLLNHIVVPINKYLQNEAIPA